ncbi:type II secretion system protein [Campylobacter magnus]
MIELIFVIVILGILASVAIPRLSGTREDAEISTAIGNLRTLLSDAASYYAVKGNFKDAAGTASANWKDFTNVPLHVAATSGNTLGAAIDATTDAVGTAPTAFLAVGGANCIGLYIVEKTATAPAYIGFTKATTNGVCGQVVTKEPVKSFIESKAAGVTLGNGVAGAMAISSNTSIYK